MEAETDALAQKMIRHAVARWISIEKVFAIIVEQFDNIKGYILEKVPSKKDFKSSVAPTERCQRINNV